jgi:hypothetical protein
MTSEERIAKLEAQIEKLNTRQSELYKQLGQAQADLWQGRIEDLEVQLHLGAMEGNDRAREMMDALRKRWMQVRGQVDDATTTVTDVGATLRAGLASAVHDVRQALLESKNRIAS